MSTGKVALITGVSGQDGSYLAELLLEKGYSVVGFGRQRALQESKNLSGIRGQIEFSVGDMMDDVSLVTAVRKHRPDEIYNLASQSHPGDSWNCSFETATTNALACHRLYDTVREIRPDCRIYQASSSEMFGEVLESPQSETTPFNPNNPYAVAKVYAHQLARVYRVGYGMFISCGILFNHESVRRGLRFITQKVAYGAACAAVGIESSEALNEQGEPVVTNGKLSLGNLSASRDWGYAPDFVRAMWMMLQVEKAEDYVIGTGQLRSIGDLCEAAYASVQLNWEEHVITDDRFLRPAETGATIADCTKARDGLGWNPSVSFDEMIAEMVDHHVKELRN